MKTESHSRALLRKGNAAAASKIVTAQEARPDLTRVNTGSEQEKGLHGATRPRHREAKGL